MKCVVCKSSDIQMKMVEEEVRAEKDIVLIPIEVLVCQNCGERYYDRKNMKKLEEIKIRLKEHDLEVEEVGKVLRAHAA
jgi:YgiT-type zinc finger domain-containing protein